MTILDQIRLNFKVGRYDFYIGYLVATVATALVGPHC